MAFQPTGYLGIVADVTIYDTADKAERRVYRMRPFNADGSPGFPFLTGVSVTLRFADVPTIEFSIDAPYEEGIRMLNSTMFHVGNTVEVVVGYVGGPLSQRFYGILQEGGMGLQINPDGVSGSVKANPLGRQAFYESTFGGRPVPATDTIRDALVQAGGFKVIFTPDAEARLDQINAQGGRPIWYDGIHTRWSLFQRMIEQTGCAYELTRDFDDDGKPTVLVSTREEIQAAAPRRRLVMRGAFDLHNGQYPMISYSPQEHIKLFTWARDPKAAGVAGSTINEAGEVVTVFQRPSDSEMQGGKEENPAPYGDPEAKSSPLGDGEVEIDAPASPFEGKRNSVPMLVEIDGKAHRAAIERMLRSYVDEGRENDAIKASIVTVGIPDLKPGEIVEVDGVGAFFNGKYTVKEVVHTVHPGSYETTISAWAGEPTSVAGTNKQEP